MGVNSMKQAAIIYDSKTGNTEKVAFAIKEGLESANVEVTTMKSNDVEDLDFFDYDLICIGTPSHKWQPTRSIKDLLVQKFDNYRKQGRIKLGSPKILGKNVLIFCTYSGPHTGISEAIPVGKYIAQFFEHLGFTILDELYVLSEFNGSEERSTMGRMGDIRGKPSEEELKKITKNAEKIAEKL